MRSLDEEIAHHLQQSAQSGELARAKGYGQPEMEDDGFNETPAALRMAFKILKDAGAAPPEIELFHERAALAAALRTCSDDSERTRRMRQLSELEQKIALRLETLRSHSGF